MFDVVCLSILGGFLLSLFFFLGQLWQPRKTLKEPYSNPSLLYPIKVIIFYLMITLRKLHAQKKRDSAGYGVASHVDPVLMDSPQSLPPSIKAIDAVFFSGSSMDGWAVILAMERRPKGLTSILVYVKVPGQSILVPEHHPDAINFREKSDEGVFRAGGLSLEMIEANKLWKLRFNGKLRPTKDPNGKLHEVKLEFDWRSSLPIFNYDSDLDPWSMSKAFAREPWSKNFFKNLREHHQTHYEQMGSLKGHITINDVQTSVELPSFRDHSYGSRREWSLMHRYYFHHVFLSDGSTGVLGLVCQPSTCTRLVLGHWWTSSGEGAAVVDIDLELQEHGEGGTPPTDYAFSFKAENVRHYVKVNMELDSTHYLSWDWESKFFEKFVRYEVDGVAGTGICEWHYRNKGGRPEHVTGRDPTWTNSLRQEYLSS